MIVEKRTTLYRLNPRIRLVDGKVDYHGSTIKKMFVNHGNTSDSVMRVIRAFIDNENGGSIVLTKTFHNTEGSKIKVVE